MMTSRPSRKGMVRDRGHGRRGWRRLTRSAPHRYAAATSAVNAVTTGANCQLVAASLQLNGGSMAPPSMTKRLPLYYLLSYSLPAPDGTGRAGGATSAGGGRRPVAGDLRVDAEVVERAGHHGRRDRRPRAARRGHIAEITPLAGGGRTDNQPEEEDQRLSRQCALRLLPGMHTRYPAWIIASQGHQPAHYAHRHAERAPTGKEVAGRPSAAASRAFAALTWSGSISKP